MKSKEWLYAVTDKDFAVIDVENFFWADRSKNDIPDLPDGRTFKEAQKEWETSLGRQIKYRWELSDELKTHVDLWHDYMYAVGFAAPGLPSIVWTELAGSAGSRDLLCAFIRVLVGRVPIVCHNSAHDVRIIKKNCGIGFDEYLRVDDSMLLHNVLWSELPHSLNFCSSIYSSQNQHKHLGTHSQVYLQGDVEATKEVWQSLRAEAAKDEKTWKIYEEFQRPLLPILLEAHEHGLRLDHGYMEKLENELGKSREAAIEVANDYVKNFGYKPTGRSKKPEILPDPERTINLNSPKQMNEWIYGTCGLKVKGLRKGKSGMYPLGKDQVKALQEQHSPVEDDDTMESRIAAGSHPLVEAKAGFTQADKFLTSFIWPYKKVERVYPQFKIHGQATGRHSTNDPNVPGMNKKIKPILIPDEGEVWVGGDWSNAELRIMAELSNDKMLKEGFAKGWDLHSMHTSQAFGWDSPKGRFLWAEQFRKVTGTWDDFSKSRTISSDRNWWGRLAPTDWKEVKVPIDFPWEQWIVEGGPQPGWLADEDLFRRFCKILVFRLLYGGSVASAAEIPGAVALGLPSQRLVQASRDLIAAHLCWQDFWDDVGGQAISDKVVRTRHGRKRRLLSNDEKARFREGVNHPIQGTVSDLLNRTLIEIKRLAPYSRYCYSVHDSYFWACPLDKRDELTQIVKEVAVEPVWEDSDFYIPFDCEVVSFNEGTKKRMVEKV